jgi:hypothetical protein
MMNDDDETGRHTFEGDLAGWPTPASVLKHMARWEVDKWLSTVIWVEDHGKGP